MKLFRRFPWIPAFLCALGFLLFLLALLLYPDAVRSRTASSISYCLSVLTPSLFPFMALSSFAVHSPAAQFLGRPLDGLTRRVFRLPGCCAITILMGFIGGYPTGARGVSLLLEKGQITRQQASRMLLFCVNPGLAFVVSFLGTGVLGNARLGWLLFLSVTVSGLLLGIITAFGAPPAQSSTASPPEAVSGALMDSVTDSARSVLLMCACVVLFSGFSTVLLSCGAFQTTVQWLSRTRFFSPLEWAALLSFVVEVTGGIGSAAQLEAAPVFYAFGLAFGGLCVHMQVLAFFHPLPVKLRYFFLSRFVHGLMSAGAFLLLCRLLPSGIVPAAATVNPLSCAPAFSGQILGGASLLLMSSAFLLITQNQTAGKPHLQ